MDQLARGASEILVPWGQLLSAIVIALRAQHLARLVGIDRSVPLHLRVVVILGVAPRVVIVYNHAFALLSSTHVTTLHGKIVT